MCHIFPSKEQASFNFMATVTICSDFGVLIINVITSNCLCLAWTSLVAQAVKNPPAMRETQVWTLGQENTLEKGMATHSSILSQKIPWTEEPGGLQSMRLQRVRHNWQTNTTLLLLNRVTLPIFTLLKFDFVPIALEWFEVNYVWNKWYWISGQFSDFGDSFT